MTIRVMHVITDLGVGGAEAALVNLLGALDRAEFPSAVVSLTTEAPLGAKIRLLEIPVTALHMRAGMPDPRAVLRLAQQVRTFKPDIIQTWMYHADLIGSAAARLAGNVPVVWGLHHTVRRRADLKTATYMVAKLNALISNSWPRQIICCAEASKASHVALGYAEDKMNVIHNGFDLETFKPDEQARRDVRRELSLPGEINLIGLCARYDPYKDHANFVRAAGLLSHAHADVHFVLWGQSVDENNAALRQLISDNAPANKVHLLGLRNDSPRLMAALDLAALSSSSEAFPLVVGEAMACAVPCVVTDVGDVRALVGETGRVVMPREPAALARGWSDLLALSRAERGALGAAARQRIATHYSIQRMAQSYARVYRDIMTAGI